MKTFFNILQTIVGIETKYYPDEPFKILNNIGDKQQIIYFINNIFYKSKDCKKTTQYSRNAFAKFTSLNDILENSLYKNEFKENILNIFAKAQKYYYAISRIAYNYKIKKHKYIVTDDLMMNKLDANNKLTFILVEDKYNYLFNINEIITIIETAIGNTQDFFSEPLAPSNPYNNRELTISTLYNIYFQMKQNQGVIPLLFHCFFLENFNKNNFSEKYEPFIRENAIKKYIFNSPYTLLYTSVIYMLKSNKYTVNLTINERFPKNVLVDIFRPFLFHYYIVHYYIKNTSKMYNSKRILDIKLKKFYEYNPLFGRETIKLTMNQNKKVIKREYVINQKYISFYNINVSSSIDLESIEHINDYILYVIGYNNNNNSTMNTNNINTSDSYDSYDSYEEDEYDS
jgi:hypothetical protein